MYILFGKLVKANGPEMLTRRINFFVFLFVLHCPPSLLIPLAQQDAVTTSNFNNLLVSRSKQFEQITPNNSIVTELIQQIDVKDDANHAISNINHVVVTGENIQNDNNGTQNNGNYELVAHNLLVSIENTSSTLNDAEVTNSLNDSSSLLLINSQNYTSGNTIKAENITIHGLQNNLANETQMNSLNTIIDYAYVNNDTDAIKEVSTVQNGSTYNVNVSSTIVPYTNIASRGTTSSISIENVTSLNESNTNNANVESVTLKSTSDTSNPIIDIKFRTGEHQGTQNNGTKEDNVAMIPLDNNQNISTLGSNATYNATLANSNSTVVEILIEDISSAEAPVFRSLIPDKIRKLQQASNVVNNELNETKDHNLVLKLLPESPPISFDLNQIPLNNLLDGALNFMKRLKRNTHDKEENSYPGEKNCTTIQIDEHHTVKYCKKSKSFDSNVLAKKVIPTRKSFDENISNVLKLHDSVTLVCPLSVLVKFYTHQLLDNNISKNDPDSVLNKIISLFMNGNEGAINLASKELFDLPFPIKLRLQLVHGKTKEFMKQLSDIVDATLCSLS